MSKTNKSAPADDGQITSIDDAPEVVADAKNTATAVDVSDHSDSFTGDKVELVINSGDGAAGKQAVFVGINGFGFNIPRDTPVHVPQEVVDQLANCMETQYESIEGGKVVEREVRRYAFSSRPIRSK
jgi:hypothetical protein